MLIVLPLACITDTNMSCVLFLLSPGKARADDSDIGMASTKESEVKEEGERECGTLIEK